MTRQEPTHPSPKIFAQLYSVLRVVLLIGIFAYLAWQVYSGRAILSSLSFRWNGLELAAALAAAVLGYQCLPAAWLLMLSRAGHFRSRHAGRYLRVWWVSYFYRYVPGKLMLLVERTRMGTALGIPATAGAALTVIETLLAIIAGSLVSLLAVAFYAEFEGRTFTAILIVSAITLFLAPMIFRTLCNVAFIKNRYPALATVAFGSIETITFVVPYILHYLLMGFSFFLVARCVFPFEWGDLSGMIGIYALSHALSLIAFVAPAGLGVREGALAVQLARELPTGVAEATAIGVRIWFTLVELFCLAVVLGFCPRPRE